ncbi:MAG: 50S ribosomal protein L29 [Myxococcales bacterium]|nr:50S ribosomal protein L29 [Myxococcales bacterium]
MKSAEVREKTTEELVGLEKDMQRQLWKARFDNHANQLDDTAQIPRLRRDLARVKTILAERQRQEATE